jgi:hypothetical protein
MQRTYLPLLLTYQLGYVLVVILSTIFVLWRVGKRKKWSGEGQDGFQTSHLLAPSINGETKLTGGFGGGTVTNFNGVGIFVR